MTENEQAQQYLYDRYVEALQSPEPAALPAISSPAAAAQDKSNASGIYFRWTPLLVPYEYTNWAEESRAHVESCYIGDWSGINKAIVRGPDALAFLSRTGMNSLARFDVGQIKHHVQLDERGFVASEGIVYRIDEETFFYSGGGSDWTAWQFECGSWDAEFETVSARMFIFEVQGPSSLATLEAATGQSLRDLGFNRGRPASIAGIPVQILRTGISGELGYEVHGSIDHGSAIWAAVVQAGGPNGLRQLGARAQCVQHIEAGIATVGLDYFPASIGTPGMTKLLPGGAPSGSFIPRNGLVDYFRYPGELGWGKRGTTARHDFVGRDALVAIDAAGGPQRTLATLVWHSADVVDLFAAQFADGVDIPQQMDMPRHMDVRFDSVRVGGEEIGVSSSRTYSASLRRTISLCVIDRAHAEPGTAVTVVWGSPETPQREIRAVVAAAPLKPDRRRTDVSLL